MLNEINLNCDENMCRVCLFMSSPGHLKLLWDGLTTCNHSFAPLRVIILACAVT